MKSLMAADSIDIRCPSCGTEYELPGSFGQSFPGAAVTCADCSKAWVPIPASGWLARLHRPRLLPIDLIAYRKSLEIRLTASLSGPEPGAAAEETAAPPTPAPPTPKTMTDTRDRLAATGQAAAGISPEAAAATVLDLGASVRPGTSSLTDDPMRGLEIEWVGVEAPYAGKRFRVTKPRTVIGRAAADMVIANERVSKKHAQLDVVGPGHHLLVDLASTNGTSVGGRPISTTNLRNGDVVSFGGVRLKFVVKAREGG